MFMLQAGPSLFFTFGKKCVFTYFVSLGVRVFQFQAVPGTIIHMICYSRMVIFPTIHGKINNVVNITD